MGAERVQLPSGLLMNKVCKKHGLTPFSDSVRPRCRKCAVESVIKTRKKLKSQAVRYKGGKCVMCGYYKYQGALEFHHLNPNEKDFAFGDKVLSWSKMKIELDKCILVCSNCHKEIHGLVA